MDLVLTMSNGTLISVGKFTDEDYITISDENQVNVFDGKQARINVAEEAMIHRWQDPSMGL